MMAFKMERRRMLPGIVQELVDAINSLAEGCTSPIPRTNSDTVSDVPMQSRKKHRKRKTDASQRFSHKQMKKRRSSRGMPGGMPFGDSLGSSSSDEDDLFGQMMESDTSCEGYCGCQYLGAAGKPCVKKVLVSFRSWRRMMDGGNSPRLSTSSTGDEDLSDSLKRKEMEIISGFEDMQLGEDSEDQSGCISMANDLLDCARIVLDKLKHERPQEDIERLRADKARQEWKLSEIEQVEKETEDVKKIKEQLRKKPSEIYDCRVLLIEKKAKLKRMKLDNAHPSVIAQLTEEINQLKENIANYEKLKSESDRKLAHYADHNHPELNLDDTGQSSSRIKYAGPVVDHQLSDYTQMRVIANDLGSSGTNLSTSGGGGGNSMSSGSAQQANPFGTRVLLVSRGDKLHVLKEYTIESEAQCNRFDAELRLLHSLRHPCVMAIEAVFYERNKAYIRMPFYDGYSLRNWLAMQGSDSHQRQCDIQSIFRMIAEGIAYLHGNNCVHRKLNLDTVIVQKNKNPVLIGFGCAVDEKRGIDLGRMLSDGSQFSSLLPSLPASTDGGNADYIAPELLSKDRPASHASDMWAFGCMLYKAHFSSVSLSGHSFPPPVLLPGKRGVNIPVHKNDHLRSLLERLLSADPSKRPTAVEVLVHGYFTTSVIQDLKSSNELVSHRKKLKSWRLFLHHLRKSNKYAKRPLDIEIQRQNIVESTLGVFSEMTPKDMLRKLNVSFTMERGVDGGGLTTDMYSQFFQRIYDPKYGLFEAADENSEMNLMLPSSSNTQLAAFEAFGKVLMKAIYDERAVPLRFPPSMYKFLLGNGHYTLADLEAFDPHSASSLRDLLTHPGADALGLDFDEFSLPSIEQGTKLTDDNKEQFVGLKIKQILETRRLAQLTAIKRGMAQSINDLWIQLQSLSCTELQLVVCGRQELSVQAIFKALHFEGYDNGSRTPLRFQRLLSKYSQQQLRAFLCLTTSLLTIPCGGLSHPHAQNRDKITIQKTPGDRVDLLPVAHTCSWVLELPDYPDYNCLEEKMALLLSTLSSVGFQLA